MYKLFLEYSFVVSALQDSKWAGLEKVNAGSHEARMKLSSPVHAAASFNYITCQRWRYVVRPGLLSWESSARVSLLH